MRIGVVSCAIMRLEMEKAMAKFPFIEKVIFLDAGKHVRPRELKESVVEAIKSIQTQVDVILLGYGRCRSLEGVGDEFQIPVVHPDAEDCIAILLTPRRYQEEIGKTAGTWFMTPGWAQLGPDMILNELGLLDRARYTGVDKEELIKELFAGYSRGLYIDTGIEDSRKYEKMAQKSCDMFNLGLEKTISDSTILENSLEEAIRIAKEAEI
ncbi:MAG: DUF1638 domain-containing protein [Nitrospinota bacterium]|nr:DUF1638 domain-containing protein [Nitrospinota bacterium]MDH5677312.1 DUF1638 domain-containing protein [Nitrospinota bacterium]MDH5755439.1 DUF1638 domain-containing protein [Nitrospinota bacterium]